MQPRHCLSASSTRREELTQARDTAGQWRSTRKARRSLPQPAAACAQATTCFWDRTHVHPWFQSPKSAMATASARPDWSTPGPQGRHFPRLEPSPAGTARRASQEPTSPQTNRASSKKRGGRRNPAQELIKNRRPRHRGKPADRARSYMTPPRRKRSRAVPPCAQETTRNPRWIKRERRPGG